MACVARGGGAYSSFWRTDMFACRVGRRGALRRVDDIVGLGALAACTQHHEPHRLLRLRVRGRPARRRGRAQARLPQGRRPHQAQRAQPPPRRRP